MTDRSNSRPLRAAGGLTAAVALLAGLNVANAQAPAPAPPLSGAGSFPQSFIVPGTNTSLHVGGQIQIDASYGFDTDGPSPTIGAYDNLAPATVGIEGPGMAAPPPNHSNGGVFRFHANNSKLFTETRTPTSYGEMKTYIEFDFQGGQATNTTTAGGSTTTKCCMDDGIPRLRMAYGTLGPWLIGKAASNFVDLAALADTLDGFVQAGGFMGAGTFRQTQIRYTWLLPNGISAAASIESAVSGGLIATTNNGGTATTSTALNWNDVNAPGLSQRVPAFVGSAQIQQPWGHAKFAVAIMQERFRNTSVAASFGNIPTGTHLKRWGYMLAQSGHYNTFGRDKLTWSISYGQGAAQYSWPLSSPDLGLNFEEGLICSGTSNVNPSASYVCSEPRVFGVNAGYAHEWTSEWRSGVSFGWDTVSKPNAAGAWGNGSLVKLEHRHWSAGASLFWTPVANVQFGLGYLYYHREVWSGARGSAHRLMTQALFRF